MSRYLFHTATVMLACILWSCRSGGLGNLSANDMIIGKWNLTRVDRQTPSTLDIKSHKIDFAINGTWTSETVMQGPFSGMQVKSSGTWSLKDSTISYTAGSNSGRSEIKLTKGQLILNPDFVIRKDGKIEVPAELY